MRLRLLAFSALLLVFGICTSATARADTFPAGVEKGPQSFSGMYPGSDAGSCCWLGERADVATRVPAGPGVLKVEFFIPDYALPPAGSESVTVQLDDGAPLTTCCLQRGYHELSVPLARNHGERVRVGISASHVFVPSAIGLNGDNRKLTLLLRGIEANTAGAPWWRYALFLLALLAAAALSRARPVFGACLAVLTAPFSASVPLGSTSVSLSTVVLLGCAAGLTLARAWNARTLDRDFLWFVGAQVLFGAALLISLAMNAAPLGGRELWKVAQALGAFLVAYGAFRAESGTRVLYASIALLTVIAAGSAFAQLAGGAPETVAVAGFAVPRAGGIFEGPNQLCAVLGMLLPLLAAAWSGMRGAARIAVAVIFALGTIAAALTFSRGGLLALALALGVTYVLLHKPAQRALAAGVSAAVFALLFGLSLLAFAGSPHAPHALFGAPQAFNGGLGTRTTLYHDAYVLWRTSPLVGIGPGNFELRAGSVGLPGVATHANSAYFQALCETGILGLGAFVLLTWRPLRTFFRNADDPLAAALCAAGIGLAVHQVVDNLLFYPKVLGVWFALLGVGFAIVNRRRLATVG